MRKPSKVDIALQELELKMIIEAYEKAKGNKASAARILDMSRTRLIGILKRYGKDELINKPTPTKKNFNYC